MTSVEEILKRSVDPREFDSPEFQHNPFPVYKRLRDHQPIYQDLFHNRWVVSRYQDIVDVFQDNQSFDRAAYNPDGEYEFGKRSVFGPNILEYGNSPKHHFLRNVVADQFVGKRLDSFLPFIDLIAAELITKIRSQAMANTIDAATKTGEVNLVSQFANQFPVRVISNMLGLPREDEDRFVGWYQALIEGLGFGGVHFMRGIAARDEMWEYIEPLIIERMENGGEDLISRIVHAERDGKRMNMLEIKGFIALLLAAGGDTTDKAISNMWYHMLYTRPDQFEAVKENPDLWTNVFSEMMRYDPVVHVQGRRTTRELKIAGEVIPWGSSVTLYLAAGNRDDRQFKDPDTFDIFRDDLHMGRELRSGKYGDGKAGHLGFGMGQHFCMGYAMARQEAVIGSRKLAEAMKNPRPKFETHYGITAPNLGSGGFRAPTELWVQFDA
ncbi:MAG: cytochrome P450 [Dehalococcoidia bacterium]